MGATEIWNVAFRSGEIRSMTLDELDAAFDAGAIDANTKVMAPGTTEWVRLGVAAGLNEPAPPPPAPSSAPQSFGPVSAPASYAPVAFSAPPPSPFGDLDLDL